MPNATKGASSHHSSVWIMISSSKKIEFLPSITIRTLFAPQPASPLLLSKKRLSRILLLLLMMMWEKPPMRLKPTIHYWWHANFYLTCFYNSMLWLPKETLVTCRCVEFSCYYYHYSGIILRITQKNAPVYHFTTVLLVVMWCEG